MKTKVVIGSYKVIPLQIHSSITKKYVSALKELLRKKYKYVSVILFLRFGTFLTIIIIKSKIEIFCLVDFFN